MRFWRRRSGRPIVQGAVCEIGGARVEGVHWRVWVDASMMI